MNFSKRNFIGVDLSANNLQAVCLKKVRRGEQISAARSRTLSAGLVVPHPRELNLPRPNDMLIGLREVIDPIAGREERLALSLPDSSGRLLLHEMETAFKSRAEGLDILRWQLKNSLPVAPQDAQIDYQVVTKNENGRYRLMVSVLAKKVLEQYEKLFNEAGYQPVTIDFHSLHVLNYYQSHVDFSDDLIMILVDGPTVVFQYFQQRQLVLHRYRDVGNNVERVFQEVNRSVAGSRDKLPAVGRAKVYLQSDWTESEELLDAVTSIFEQPVHLLEPTLGKPVAASAGISKQQGRSLVAALGAAGRLI